MSRESFMLQGFASLAGVFITGVLLSHFGRKTLLITGISINILTLLLLGIVGGEYDSEDEDIAADISRVC